MIITDEKLLRVECQPVLLNEVDDLRKKLDEALVWSASRGQPGVGIAAPQIGIAKNMAIVRIKDIKVDLVNAVISNFLYPFVFEGEGCLSFPNIFRNTNRYKEIKVENNLVWPYSFIATDFLAVVIQHELDHLRSKLLIDEG